MTILRVLTDLIGLVKSMIVCDFVLSPFFVVLGTSFDEDLDDVEMLLHAKSLAD